MPGFLEQHAKIMKIALVHMRHAHTGGTERYLNLLALELAEHGHAVSIVCRSHEELDHPNIRFVALRPLALGKSLRMWRFAKAVEKHVMTADYDLVYALGKTWTHDVIRIGGGSHKRFLENMPGHQMRLRDRVSLALEARAFRPGNYRLVIANSRMCAAEIAEDFNVPSDKIVMIHNSVSLQRFQQENLPSRARALRQGLGIEEDTLLYLFLGTGYERKGLDPLLQAFSRADFGGRDARLLVIGYDSRQAEFQRRARALGLGDRVVFAGGRRDAEVCYAAADVYVLPTRYDPFANTTLEALASGLPVITTRTNGGSEVVQPECGDVLSSGGDVDSLRRALERWQDDEARQVAAIAAHACAARHDHRIVMASTSQLLEKLAAAVR